MVKSRRKSQDLLSRNHDLQFEMNEMMDNIARSLGIQTGRESWWESDRATQEAKIIERAKFLRKNAEESSTDEQHSTTT